MSITPDITSGRSSRRVEAWIYTVINPLIDAMGTEHHLLEKGNLSWRYHSRRAEFLHSIRDSITPHYWPNLEDFVAENERFTEGFGRHDKALQSAENAAR